MNNLLNNLKNMNTFASISSNKGNSNIGSKSSKKKDDFNYNIFNYNCDCSCYYDTYLYKKLFW